MFQAFFNGLNPVFIIPELFTLLLENSQHEQIIVYGLFTLKVRDWQACISDLSSIFEFSVFLSW